MQLLAQMPVYILHYISRHHAVETLRAHARPKLMEQCVRSQNLRLWKALQAISSSKQVHVHLVRQNETWAVAFPSTVTKATTTQCQDLAVP